MSTKGRKSAFDYRGEKVARGKNTLHISIFDRGGDIRRR